MAGVKIQYENKQKKDEYNLQGGDILIFSKKDRSNHVYYITPGASEYYCHIINMGSGKELTPNVSHPCQQNRATLLKLVESMYAEGTDTVNIMHFKAFDYDITLNIRKEV
jgi:hypothetical protein